MDPFLLLLLSHILGDVIFASNRLAVLKRKSGIFDQILANGWHTSLHAFFAGLIFFLADREWVWPSLLVFSFHFLIDFIRCKVEIHFFGPGRVLLTRKEVMVWIFRRKKALRNIPKGTLAPWFLINFTDQAAHLCSLYAISEVVGR